MRPSLFFLGLVMAGCGSDEPVDRLPMDTGMEREHQRPNDTGDAGVDDRPERRDVGLTVPDGGFAGETDGGAGGLDNDSGPLFGEDAGGDSGEDAGIGPEPDAGPVDPGNGEERRALLLQQRQLSCDGEALSTATFTWDDRRLTRIQLSEMNFPVFDWRITQENGRPIEARSNLDGWNLEARWTYTAGRLTSALMGDAEEVIEWRFEYDQADRPVRMNVTEEFEGQISEQSAETTWGLHGPTTFFGTDLDYQNARPSLVNDLLPVLYDENDVFQGVGGDAFRLRYHPGGALAELDLLDGCIYRFTWTAGEPAYYRGSLGLGDFAMLYDVEGRYAGDFDPATELYLVILLLLGE